MVSRRAGAPYVTVDLDGNSGVGRLEDLTGAGPGDSALVVPAALFEVLFRGHSAIERCTENRGLVQEEVPLGNVARRKDA